MKTGHFRFIWRGCASVVLTIITCLPGTVLASSPNCEMPSTSFSTVKTDGQLRLNVVLANETHAPITLEQTSLLEGLMQFSAKKEGGGYLKHFSALVAPGVMPIVLLPGKIETQSFNLDESFPDLDSALADGNVVLTWQLEIAPRGSDCSVQSKGTLTLRRKGVRIKGD